MSQSIDVNGVTISYPETGDVDWGSEGTNFAIQVAAALGKLGLGSGTTASVVGTLTVAGNTILNANLTVFGNSAITGNETITGNLIVNGNTTLGNANTDTIAITGIVNVDSGVLYVDPTTNKVGINDTTPSEALDVTGNVAITGNETIGGTLGVTGNTTLSGTLGVTGNTTLSGTLGVTGNTTVDGVIYADDNTTANTPVISFIGDTNTGLGRSAADTLDLITNGNSRFRIESTGQIKAVYESTIGTDYNTSANLANGYLCRAWVNFNGTGTVAIRSSGNVSSITDNGTGDYTINFTTNMPDADYAVISNQQFDVSAAASPTFVGLRASYGATTLKSTSQYRIVTTNFNGSNTDAEQISSGVFR
jgi:hypothetical protein